MRFFKHTDRVIASKTDVRARSTGNHTQQVELSFWNEDRDKLVVTFELEQVRRLIGDLSIAYEACRPPLIDRRTVDRVTAFYGMR